MNNLTRNMDWTESFVKAIRYVEDHLLEDISIEDISRSIYVSSSYFQKAFSLYTGYPIGVYIKNRRLYKAALDIRQNDISIIDVSLKYLYETPEAFTKAFKRFHGITPKEAKNPHKPIQIFLPLHIKISIEGGEEMEVKIEKESKIVLVGKSIICKDEEGYEKCPKFWDEFSKEYFSKLNDGSEISKFIIENAIGEFAYCDDSKSDGTFKYTICGIYKGSKVPEGFEIIEIESETWAKFRCVGPMPSALQTLNNQIWHEWFPNHPEYQTKKMHLLEWYSMGDTKSEKYESGIWVPVVKK